MAMLKNTMDLHNQLCIFPLRLMIGPTIGVWTRRALSQQESCNANEDVQSYPGVPFLSESYPLEIITQRNSQ